MKKLVANRNIELRKNLKKSFLILPQLFLMEKNIKVELINSTFKNEIMSYCSEYLLE